jgi:flotillin
MMIADKLPELVKTQVEAIKNIKIDKVTVWETGNGKDGKTSTANFMQGLLGSIPPLEDVFKSAGMELPNYLKGPNKEEESKRKVKDKPDNIEDGNIVETKK